MSRSLQEAPIQGVWTAPTVAHAVAALPELAAGRVAQHFGLAEIPGAIAVTFGYKPSTPGKRARRNL